MATLIAPVSQISSDNEAVVCEIFVSAPRERIFQALTDPHQAVQWWGAGGAYRMTEFQMDVRPGGKWSTSGLSARTGNIKVEGEFLEIDPPSRLAYTWISSWLPKSTTVLWELKAENNGTRVKLTHTGFAGDAQQTKGHSDGWSLALGWLQAYAEKGETVDNRK